MFHRLGSFSAAVLQTVVVLSGATLSLAAPATSSIPASQCNTGSIQCCNSLTTVNNPAVGVIATLLGIPTPLPPSADLVGLTCSPVSVIGVGGNSCSAQLVCCEDNSFNGIIALGCTPVIIVF